MEKSVQKYLLQLARKTIAEELGMHVHEIARPLDHVGTAGATGADGVSVEHKSCSVGILDEKRGVFVTLEIGGSLRGCIGTIVPVYTLEEGVKRNALNAAFEDPRFPPLEADEFEKVKIEISVLSVPKKLEYHGSADLLAKLRPLKDGVILQKGYYEATYLPQVWEEIPDKKQFLSSLCMKAGLPYEEWEKGELTVMTYQAEAFSE